MTSLPALLTVERLSKSFPGQQALTDVSLRVRSGEVVALVGQNGSGKSTLVKILTGVHNADPGGSIQVHNVDGSIAQGADARARIHVIHQDLGLIPALSTVENLGLSGPRGARALLPNRTRSQAQSADRMLRRFGLCLDVRARVDSLSAGERTIVALVRALNGWTRHDNILLLDEPTASLHGSEVDRLFRAVRDVAASGAGVVFISHRLDEVLGVADRVVALRGGRVVADVPCSELDRRRLIQLIAGRDVSESRGPRREQESADAALSLRGLAGGTLHELDLDVRRGEIVGIAGILGSGREHVCGLAFGLHRLRAGEVSVLGRRLIPRPRTSIAAGVGYVPADRRTAGAVMVMTALENLALTAAGRTRDAWRPIRRRTDRHDAQRWFAKVELDPPDPDRRLDLFSGGNQQKVVLAKWLRNDPAVLLLDEPTQGVDVGAKAAIYDLLEDAAQKGAAVLVSSSDTAELAALCDRVVVLRDGLAVAELHGDRLNDASLTGLSLNEESEAHTSKVTS
jgi:ribose transport system ATP-binding protein